VINPGDIHPLTDFKRNTGAFRDRLRKTGLPAVLTVEGRPELVVQDARAYQRMVDALERAQAIEGIREGLASKKNGKGRPAARVFADLRRKLGIPGTKRA